MDLFDIDPDLDRWVDDNCIITLSDRVEATLNGEAMYAEVVSKKLVELAKEREALLGYAKELLEDLEEYHHQFGSEPLAIKHGMGLALTLKKPTIMNREDC